MEVKTCIIFSCQMESKERCLNELLATGWGIKFDGWLGHGAGIIRCDGTFSEFSDSVRIKPLIFLQHIFPVEHTIYWNTQYTTTLFDTLDELASRMCLDKSFSVQMRHTGTLGMEAQHLKREMQTYFESKGFKLQVSHPTLVVSVFCTEERIMLGLSHAAQNLSDWTGGMRKYAFRPETISRAEFKLLEAIEYFSIRLPTDGLAVDLGAAPGGWTRILLENGMRVIAVDPANLSSKLDKHPNLTHFRGLAQNFLKENASHIDVLVNDMKMDTLKSVSIMNEMSSSIKDGGLAIITFKLPQSKKTAVLNKGLALLSKKYSVKYVKQLFHNRSEITVIARKET